MTGKPPTPSREHHNRETETMINIMNKSLLSNAALGIAGVALVSTMVVRASSAAFTGSTSNDANSWDAGTVSLTDNDGAAAKFTVTNMKPGATGTACIEVKYTGSITPVEAIKLYGTVTNTDGAGGATNVASGQLSDDLDIVVNVFAATQTCATGTPTRTAVYTGTLGTLPTAYASGSATSWTPTGGANEVRAFELTYTLGSDTANDAQGDGADANFVWEASS